MTESALARWRDDLASWALPPEVEQQAPESPWGFPVELFARRVAWARATETPSRRFALEELPTGGSVLDVGSGAGAASLALVPPAGRIVAVDTSLAMLERLEEQAVELGVPTETVEGRWPDVAGRTPVCDVVVCHHVLYNVADLEPFLAALREHARRRVVVEVTEEHPMAALNDLWLRFWGLERPTRPTADDVEAVFAELGIAVRSERFEGGPDPIGEPDNRAEAVAFVRRRLCLPPERDPEVAAALTERPVRPRRLRAFAFAGAA
jgi:SAM-dependent methyltransferase